MPSCGHLLVLVIVVYALGGLLLTGLALVSRLRGVGWRLGEFKIEWLIPVTQRAKNIYKWYQRIGWAVLLIVGYLMLCPGSTGH